MKTLSHFIAISLLAIIIAIPTRSYAAKTYSYTCSDGGTVNTTVDITPSGPFTPGTRPTFKATGFVSSTCGTKSVSLTAENKKDPNSMVGFEPIATLIPPVSLDYGQTYPTLPAQTTFTAPATVGDYIIHFLTGVDDNVLPQINGSFVFEFQHFVAYGGNTPYTPGFDFTAGVCLSDVAPQDEPVLLAWNSSNGSRYSAMLTVKAGEKCFPSTPGQPYYVSGPATGTAGGTSDICARAENPGIHVGPGVTECPPNQPWVFFSANPMQVKEGSSSTLQWSSNYADSCTSPDFDTAGKTSGSASTGPLSPNPTQATGNNSAYVATYSLTCTGPGGSTSSALTIHLCHEDPITKECVF